MNSWTDPIVEPDWIWIPECPVRPNPASAFPSFNSFFLFTTAALESPAGEEGEMNSDPAFSFLPKLPL